MKNILITGGTGAIGTYLIEILLNQGFKVAILSRKKSVQVNSKFNVFYWNINNNYIDKTAFKNIDIIIHLAGENIGSKKWSVKRKKEILISRIKSTNLLYQYVKKYKPTLKQFVSASAVGYYGTLTTKNVFSETDLNGSDFLADVCYKWEKEVKKFHTLNIRTVIVRTGVVLSKTGGILSKMIIPVKLGLNSAIGSGNQIIPWVHIYDICNVYLFAINNHLEGVFNCVSSHQINNKDFSKEFSKVLNKPFFLPNIPTFLIKLFFGEMSIILLEGSFINNSKIKKEGFVFKFDNLNQSLEDLLLNNEQNELTNSRKFNEKINKKHIGIYNNK